MQVFADEDGNLRSEAMSDEDACRALHGDYHELVLGEYGAEEAGAADTWMVVQLISHLLGVVAAAVAARAALRRDPEARPSAAELREIVVAKRSDAGPNEAGIPGRVFPPCVFDRPHRIVGAALRAPVRSVVVVACAAARVLGFIVRVGVIVGGGLGFSRSGGDCVIEE